MHELAFCQSILKTLKEELVQKGLCHTGLKVKRVKLVVGVLHALIPESLKLAWGALTAEEEGFTTSELEVLFKPLRIYCKQCKAESELKEPFLICPRCQSSALSTLSGEELYIESIEVAEDGS